MPALLNRTSSRPNDCLTASNSATTDCGLLTSVTIGVALPASLASQLDAFIERVAATPGERDLVAIAQQCMRDGTTDAAAGARDDGDL